MTQLAIKRRECIFAIKIRDQYNKKNIDEYKLIQDVWGKIKNYADAYDKTHNNKGKHIVENSTKALIQLTDCKRNNSWIDGKSILTRANIKDYRQNMSYGLWPWLEKTGAGVILERGKWPDTQYKIKDEFYALFYKTITVNIKSIPLT